MITVLKWLSLNYIFLIEVVLVFGLMIFVHELGHFIVAKLFKTRVLEFSLGMGPKLIKIRRGETDYCLRLFPVGGFVNIEGEDEKPENKSDPNNFQNKSVWQRMGIVVSGCVMNYIAAFIMFFLIAVFVGVLISPTKIDEVVKDTPAYKAGLKKGDIILSINGKKMKDGKEMVMFINTHPGKKLDLEILRGEKTFHTEAVPFVTPDYPLGRIGIVPYQPAFVKASFFDSIRFSLQSVYDYTVMPLLVIKKMITREIPFSVIKKSSAGPIGIGSFIFLIAKHESFVKLVYLAAILNVAIGFFNLLPFPALDGARLVFLGIEAVRRKPIDQEIEGKIHWVGLALLLLLVILVSYQDILRLINL